MNRTTTQRPTPETDDAKINLGSACGQFSEWYVKTDFAGKLERERDEARERIKAMREAIREASVALCRYDVEDIDLVESEEMTITVTAEDQKALRQSLAKLQPLLKP